mgnify:CR=1 FL=1
MKRLNPIYEDYGNVISDRVCNQIISEGNKNILSKSEVIETVNHPSHYQGKYEAIDIIEDACKSCPADMAFSYGNAIKYLLRAYKKHESPVEDLKKATWYINRIISETESKED